MKLGETATKERAKKDGGIVEEVVKRALNGAVTLNRQRVRMPTLIDEYYLTGRITDEQKETGLRFRSYYRIAAGIGGVSSFAKLRAGGKPGNSDNAIFCRDKIKEAAQILGKRYQAVESVCVFDERPGDGGWRKMIALRDGLNELYELW